MKSVTQSTTLAFSLALAAMAGSLEAGFEETLVPRWEGHWVVVRTEVSSDCGGLYTDNRFVGGSAAGKGAHRFPRGELARVHKLDLKRERLDLLLDLAEPLRIARREGPFTLYDHVHCKIELEIPLPRNEVRDAELGLVEPRVKLAVERYSSAADAERSKVWNRRRAEPFPEGYEQTLREYEIWLAAEHNRVIEERLHEAAREAARVTDRIDDDPDYLAGFAAGVEALRRERFGDCERLVATRFSSHDKRTPSGHSDDWEDGWEDGQRLVYNLTLLRELPDCLAAIPLD